MEIDKELLDELAQGAIDDYFASIDSIVEDIVDRLAETFAIEDEDDIEYLRNKVMRGILTR